LSHNSRIRGSSDAWANIQPSELTTLDANLAAGLNGVDGSTHSPATPIEVGGDGLQVTGPLAVIRGGQVMVTSAGAIVLDGGFPAWTASTNYDDGDVVTPTSLNGRRYLCTTPGKSGATQPTFPTAYTSTVTDGSATWTCLGPDGDVPQYSAKHAGRSRTIVYPLAGGRPVVPGTWRVRHVDGAVQSIAPMMDISDGSGPLPARWIVPLRVHDTATITSVSVSFRVGWTHTALPSVMPGMRLLRLPTSGIPQPLTSTAAGADVNGYVYAAKPATAAAWTGQQTLTLPCDQNNVADVATYTYVLEIIEEQWPGAPLYPWSLVMKQPVKVATTTTVAYTDLLTVDGYTTVDGDRVLVKDAANPAGNGLFIAHAGPWTYAPDLTLPSDFSQGMIVPVVVGVSTVNGGSSWQCATSITTWPIADTSPLLFFARGPDDDETHVNTGTQFFAHGSTFQTAAVTYSGITEQAFQ
jgi:hypothetical protein